MRIILVSGLDLVRDSLTNYLEQLSPSIEVTAVPSLDTALTVALADGPSDIILLDDRMLAQTGAAALEPLRTLLSGIPLAVLASAPGQRYPGARVIPLTFSGSLPLSVIKSIAAEKILPKASAGSCEAITTDTETVGHLSLTRREQQVLALLSQGFANKQITRRLTIEEVTVRLHLRGVFRKLGVHNRTQAVSSATACGLLALPDRPATVASVHHTGVSAAVQFDGLCGD